MRLIHLGTGAGGVPRPGGAGSGHLVQDGSTNLLLDCGNGVLGNLARYAPLQRVDAVYLTHLHADHFSDLYPFLLQRTRYTPLTVYAPPGSRRKLDTWLDVLSSHPDLYRAVLDLHEVEGGRPFKVGGLKVTPVAVEHNTPAFGCRVEAGRTVLAYTGDARQSPAVVELARNASVLLCEATLQDGVGDAEFNRRQLASHMTARQAGEVAQQASARSLLLTHLLYYLDPEQSVKQAMSACLCPTSVAREHAVHEF